MKLASQLLGFFHEFTLTEPIDRPVRLINGSCASLDFSPIVNMTANIPWGLHLIGDPVLYIIVTCFGIAAMMKLSPPPLSLHFLNSVKTSFGNA